MWKNKIKAMVEHWMKKLDKKFNKLSHHRQFIILVLCCTGLALFSIYTLCISIEGTEHERVSFQRINIPTHIVAHHSKNETRDSIIDNKEYKEIKLYQNYLDSLSKTEKGKSIWDSILQYNPGLTDSLQWLENIYLSPLNH